MKESTRKWLDCLPGPIAGLAAFIVYCASLSVGPFPGRSAGLIAECAGLMPRLTPANPVWRAIAWLLAHIPVGTLSQRLNLFSAVCGGMAVWLMYHVVSRAVLLSISVDERNVGRSRLAAVMAGTGAALFLAFCQPFWTMSNRAHVGSFDVLFLLAVTSIFIVYVLTTSMRVAMLFAFLYGIGTVEYVAFIPLAPLFGLFLTFLLWKNEQLRMKYVMGLVLFAALGLSLYFLSAWQFHGTEGYHLRGYADYWQVLWYTWRDQYWAIAKSLPKTGWLIVVMATVVPWVTCIGIAKRGLNEEKDWSYYLLHLVVTGLVVSVLINANWLFQLFGHRQPPLTPYVLTASVFGYLIAYWFLLPFGWRSRGESRREVSARNLIGLAPAVAGLVVALVMPFRNVATAGAGAAAMVNSFAGMVIDSLAGRSWLVTDGSFDDNLLVVGAEKGSCPRLLNMRAGRNPIYVKRLAEQLPTTRLKNLAEIGLAPMLQEWLESDPAAGRDVAILADPDFWVGAGKVVQPNRTLFLGAESLSDLDAASLLADHEAFWSELEADMKEAGGREVGEEGPGGYVARHVSMVANNLGVLMLDMGRTNDAFRCYTRARDIHPANISALLNQKAMIDGGFLTDQAGAVGAEFEKLIKAKQSYRAWMLARYYGYVRTPGAFARLGWIWAQSGMRGAAGSQLKRAMALLPESERNEVRRRLGALHVEQDHDEAAEAQYYEVLVENPGDARALLGVARIATRAGDIEKAESYIEKAREAGAPATVIKLEHATVKLVSGDVAGSKALLESVTQVSPGVLRAWSMLGVIAIQQNKKEDYESCVKHVAELDKTGALAWLMRGEWAGGQGDLAGARDAFEAALSKTPTDINLLERLLGLYLTTGQKTAAESRAKMLLSIDRNNALANYTMGSIRVSEGQYDQAEDFLRTSVASKRSPHAMNDLAWTLLQRGKNEEAARLAGDAVNLIQTMPELWDTLGLALMRTGDLDGAEQAFERSLALSQNHLGVFMNMAELQIMKGNDDRARELLAVPSEKEHMLSGEQRTRLDDLKRRL